MNCNVNHVFSNRLQLTSSITSDRAHQLLSIISIRIAHNPGPGGLSTITAEGCRVIWQIGQLDARSPASSSLEPSMLVAAWWCPWPEVTEAGGDADVWLASAGLMPECVFLVVLTGTDQRGLDPRDFLSAGDFCVLGEWLRFTSNVFNKRKWW